MQPLRNRLPAICRFASLSLCSAKGAGSWLAVFLLPLSLLASSADALKHYQSGKYDTALKEYDRLRQDRPHDARLAFNAGAAAYQAKQFEAATRLFSGATGSRDPKLAQSAFYNLGNAQFQLGETAADTNQKREAWESALGFYDTALKLDSADAEAKHNREFVQRKLEELKQQQEQQPDKNQQDQKKQDKPDDQKKQDDQKQDKPGDDKKPDDKKSEEQKQPKPDGSKQDKPDPQNPPPQPDKPGDQKQPDPKKPQDQKGDQKPGQPGEQGEKDPAQAAAALGQMTPQQAMQLLDAQRAEERTLVFQPTNTTQKANSRVMKNW